MPSASSRARSWVVPSILGVALAVAAVIVATTGDGSDRESPVAAADPVTTSTLAPAETAPPVTDPDPPTSSTPPSQTPSATPQASSTTLARTRFCVIDTTPLNLRSGPGTEHPALTAIPIDRCDVFDAAAIPEVTTSSAGKPWRRIEWLGTVGWVADWLITQA